MAKESVNGLPRPHLHPRSNLLLDTLELLLFLLAIYVLIEMAAPRFIVDGPSMEPTFYYDQRLVVSRVGYLVNDPQRGDIVVFNAPGAGAGDPPLIKRAIGLPGDTVEFRNQQLYINGERQNEPYINEPCTRCADSTLMLDADQYFVMGDNRNHSNDSRAFGPVQRENIIGEALIRFWPPDAWGIIDAIAYP
jgi:signal peptidase I